MLLLRHGPVLTVLRGAQEMAVKKSEVMRQAAERVQARHAAMQQAWTKQPSAYHGHYNLSPRSPRRQQFRVPRVQTLRPNEQHEMVVAPATGPFTVAKFW